MKITAGKRRIDYDLIRILACASVLRRDLSRIISAKYNRFMEHITNKAFSVSFPFLHR